MNIRRLMKEENGQSLIMVAIFIVVLFGFSGLVIDGGRLYLAKSQLQKAVDAGALAGADLMLDEVKDTGAYNHTDSEIKAKEIAVSNYDKTNYDVSFPNDNIIKVNGEENVSLFLMPILGINNQTHVSAEAQVQVGGIAKVEKGTVIPIGLKLNHQLEFGETWNLKTGPDDSYKGNFNFLEFSSLEGAPKNPSGADGVYKYIKDGSPVPIIINKTVDTQPGNTNKSDIISEINKKIGTIVYVPIISEVTSGGRIQVTILGFAAFELLGFFKDKDDHIIRAKFIKEVLPGEIGNVTTEYGTYASKLIY